MSNKDILLTDAQIDALTEAQYKLTEDKEITEDLLMFSASDIRAIVKAAIAAQAPTAPLAAISLELPVPCVTPRTFLGMGKSQRP